MIQNKSFLLDAPSHMTFLTNQSSIYQPKICVLHFPVISVYSMNIVEKKLVIGRLQQDLE